MSRIFLAALLGSTLLSSAGVAEESGDVFGQPANGFALRIVARKSFDLGQPIWVWATVKNAGEIPVSILPVFGQMTFKVRDSEGKAVGTKDPIGCIKNFSGPSDDSIIPVIAPGATRMDPYPNDLNCFQIVRKTYEVTGTTKIYGSSLANGAYPVLTTATSNTITITVN